MEDATRKRLSEKYTGSGNPMFGKKHTLESRRKNSEGVKARWQTPEYRAKMKKSKETRLKMSIARGPISKRLWQSSEFVAKQIKAHNTSPNKTEQMLQRILDDLFPGEWNYVGDGQLIIDRKCPDFVHRTKKRIIELFGDYWHKEDEVSPRITLFEKHQYQVLVIWEHELQEPEILKQKLLQF